MRTQVGALLLLAALLLAGCQTKYQETGLTGGYKDKQLGPDRYQISASGNGYTSEQRIADMMMLRAAELTLQHGYARWLLRPHADPGRLAGRFDDHPHAEAGRCRRGRGARRRAGEGSSRLATPEGMTLSARRSARRAPR
jgi:hypothetical protein